MTPGNIVKRTVTDRLAWIDQMVDEIRALPLSDRDAFFADRRNVWTAESCLRRALEALFDLGRHILAKGFGTGVTEYKEIAVALRAQNVLGDEEAALLRTLAGYRNRMVHFYHEVQPEELYEICSSQLSDIERLASAYKSWLLEHSEYLDESL